MSKKIRKFFLIGLLCLNLITISQPEVFAFDKSKATSLQEQMELIQNDIKTDDLDIEPFKTDDLKKNVVPDAKQEGKKVILLFFQAMLVVAVSGVAIYALLIIVRYLIKKYKSSDFMQYEDEDDPMLNLTAPTDKQSAFISFLNRTSL